MPEGQIGASIVHVWAADEHGVDQRHPITLSAHCWQCIDALRSVYYSVAYAEFAVLHSELIRAGLHQTYPKSKENLIRFVMDGMDMGISIAPDAVDHFAPAILEFITMGAAVKALGLYEAYVRSIGRAVDLRFPGRLAMMAKARKLGPRSDWLCGPKAGRGIALFNEVFGFDAPGSYEPALDYFFELRNVSVHRSGLVDERLRASAVKVGLQLAIGSQVRWSLENCLRLHQLLCEYLPAVDALVVRHLGLNSEESTPHWLVDEPE